MKHSRIMGAEAFGTFLLMMGGPGTAILVPAFDGKVLMVSLAFGLSLLVAAYSGHCKWNKDRIFSVDR